MWRDVYTKGADKQKGGNGSPVTGDALLDILTQERERTGALVSQWLEQQKEQAAQQQRLLQGLLEAQQKTIQDLAGKLGKEAVPAQNTADARVDAVAKEAEKLPEVTAEELDLEHDVEDLQKCENMMHWWKRASGLQTVEKWVTNYHKHPAGWGALLLIQGIPEVTGRLRSKVENYAIYSALFLSMSIALLAEKPELVDTECSEEDYAGVDWWLCHFRFRLFFYGFSIGTATHMLSIMLAMSFVNALNEAARDSDVYRMFSRGQGFYATVRCQNAFRIGCVADLLAVITAASYHIGWEAVVGAVVLAVVTGLQVRKTAKLLFSSASITDYWREERGGKPDKDDPYDLQVPIGVFRETLRVNNKFFMESKDLLEGTGSTDSALWGPLQRAMRGGEVKGAARKGAAQQGQSQAQSAAVAAMF